MSTYTNHTDAYESDLYKQRVDKTVSYGNATSTTADAVNQQRAGRVYHLTSPSTSVTKLTRKSVLIDQIAQRNRIRYQKIPPTFPETPDQLENFGLAFVYVLPRALAAEGVAIDKFPIEEKYVFALGLKQAFGFGSDQDLRLYIVQSNELHRIIGFNNRNEITDRSRFSQTRSQLRQDGYLEVLRRAAVRAVYACYRNGVPTPASIYQRYPFGVHSSASNVHEIPEPIQLAAVRAWARHFRDNALDSFSFHRSDNKSISIQELFGVLAHSALQSIGPSESRASGRHVNLGYPDGTNLMKLIDSLSFDEIEGQFQTAYRHFFDECRAAGLLGGSDGGFNVAGDAVRFPFAGSDNIHTITRPSPDPDELEIEEWTFVSVCIIDSDSRFVFGIPYIDSKDKLNDALERLLEEAQELTTVRCVFLDREFAGTAVIRTLRRAVGKRWIIHAKIYEDSAIREEIKRTPSGTRRFTRVAFGDLHEKPNCYLHPKEIEGDYIHKADPQPPDIRQQTLDGVLPEHHGLGDHRTHKPLLTGLSERDFYDLAGVHTYETDRENIEAFFRQLKHGLHPYTESGKRALQVFAVNAGTLFYNYHTLINRAPDPEYGVQLDIPHQEFLTVLRDELIQPDEFEYPFDF